MRELELFRLDSLPAEVPFSSAVRVGDTVYVSGQIGHQPGEMRLVEGGSINHTQKFLARIAQVTHLFDASFV